MAEPHLKTAGVPKSTRHQEDVSASVITPTEDVSKEFKLLKMRRKYRYILYKIEGSNVAVDTTGSPSATFSDFMNALPESECRYAIYDHDIVTSDGRKTSKLYFVTWIPQNSHPGFKMAYTHAKGTIRPLFEGCFDVNAVMKKEIEQGIGITSGDASDSGSDFED